MKKLWLSAIAAACLLAGNAAQAGERHHGHRGDWGHHREHRHDGHHYGHNHHRHHHYGHHHAHYGRPVVYVPRPVYYERPGYYERPVYYGRGDGEIHGSITVGF